MHSDFQNTFVRIHLLYHANQQAISAKEILPEINSHGFNVTEDEVEKQLSHLSGENFLTADGSAYSITDAGKRELKDAQSHLKPLYKEVGKG